MGDPGGPGYAYSLKTPQPRHFNGICVTKTLVFYIVYLTNNIYLKSFRFFFFLAMVLFLLEL